MLTQLILLIFIRQSFRGVHIVRFLITQFFPFSFIYFFLILVSWPNHCRRRELMLHLITLYDTHTPGRTPLEEGSARRKYLYLTTHNTHNRKDSHVPGGIRTGNPSKRAAAEPRLRARGHYNRPLPPSTVQYRQLDHHSSYFRRVTASTVATYTTRVPRNSLQ